MKIINPWHDKRNGCSRPHYNVGKPVYKTDNGEIYKLGKDDYLHCFKGFAVTELGGKNKELLNKLENNVKPFENVIRPNGNDFVYDRAVETLNKQLNKVKK